MQLILLHKHPSPTKSCLSSRADAAADESEEDCDNWRDQTWLPSDDDECPTATRRQPRRRASSQGAASRKALQAGRTSQSEAQKQQLEVGAALMSQQGPQQLQAMELPVPVQATGPQGLPLATAPGDEQQQSLPDQQGSCNMDAEPAASASQPASASNSSAAAALSRAPRRFIIDEDSDSEEGPCFKRSKPAHGAASKNLD